MFHPLWGAFWIISAPYWSATQFTELSQCDEKSSLFFCCKPTVALVRKILFGYKCIVSLKSCFPQGIKTKFDFLYQQIHFFLFFQWSASRLCVKITQQTRVSRSESKGFFLFTRSRQTAGAEWSLHWEASAPQTASSRSLKLQVLIYFLPSVPRCSEGSVTVMDSCKLGTNKTLQVVDLGPGAPVDGPSRRPTLN